MSRQSLSEKRQKLQAYIPALYHPYLLFLFTNLIVIAFIAVAISQLHEVQPSEWLVLPTAFFVANVSEYLVHRGPMHNRRSLVDILFRRHTLGHHEYFPHDCMGFDQPREAYWVLFPFWAIFLVFAAAIPLAAVVWYLWSFNAAIFMAIVAVGYYILYEWLHLSYHLPENSKIGQLGIIRKLKRHHQRHHDKSLMNSHNFNITFPIGDAIFRTSYRDEP